MKKFILFLFIFIQTADSLMAQNDSIPYLNSDRPTQSESPFLMQKGFFQIETGASYVDREDTEKQLESDTTWNNIATVWCFHIILKLDFQIAMNMVHVQLNEEPNDSTESGMGPVTAGFKVFVAQKKVSGLKCRSWEVLHFGILEMMLLGQPIVIRLVHCFAPIP